MPAPPDPAERATPRQATLREIVSAVLWGFFGVRKGARLRQDAGSIRPHQIIIAGIIVSALFVVLLIAIAWIVVRVAGA